MTNRQAVTLADVLNKDSSVRFTGQTGGITDSFFIRGFPISEGNIGEIAFDGVYGVAPDYHVFSTYVERVEIIKGPAALLYGMSPNSGVGGVVNIVPKRSLPEDLTRITADYASSAQAGAQVDLSRRFGKNREWGIRVNGLHRQGDTALDNQSSRTSIGALSLDYRGERLRASLDTLFQDEKIDAPTRPMLVAPGLPVPKAPNGHRNVTQSWGWWKSQGQSALLHAEYDVNDRLTAFANVGGSQTSVTRLSDQTPTILNEAGDTTSTPRHARFSVDRYTADTGLRAQIDTGPVSHAITLQASIYKDRLAQASIIGDDILTNIYTPIDHPRQNIARPDLPKVSSSRLSGVALADTMGFFDDRAQITLGLRHQRIESDNYNASTGALTASYDKSALTPLVGLVVKPWENVSLYANYIEGLSKGDIAPSTASNAGEVFAPYKSKQYEVGLKVDLNTAIATVSAFQISKPSGQLNGTVYEANSKQRNRGIELNLSGEPTKGLRLLGGVTLLDAQLTETNSAATLDNRPVGVPKIMANIGAEWDLPWVAGLSINGNVTYTGKQYVDQANMQSVPSWATVDLGARYETQFYGRDTTIRLTVLNAFNRAYWSGVASYGTISQGIPRTVMLSASMDF
jgi:iron complex outermembrane receptor protein